MMPTIKDIERVTNSNENAMQFILDRPLTKGNEYVYKSFSDAGENDMAYLLLGLEDVTQVKIADHTITVSQDGDTEWSQLLKQLAPFVRDAEPLDGIEWEVQEDENENRPGKGSNKAVFDTGAIGKALRSVIDPELGINMVDLGLVYNIMQNDDNAVVIEFTATTPGCPLRRYFEQHMSEALEVLGYTNYELNLVWEPRWSVNLIKEGVGIGGAPRPPAWG
jgi:metal-sulfur cluster biosynthetic enzyme